MKYLIFLIAMLLLNGCSKSEIDKCVEAQLKSDSYDCKGDRACIKEWEDMFEGDYRRICLKAAAGK